MPTADTDGRLEAAVKDRNDLIAEIQRIEGRLEAAQAQLEQAQAECREKGIEPDKLDTALTRLDERYEALVSTLETDIADARAALAPYLGDTDEDRSSKE
jgi:predicted nuclease with TOPRIM domain